MQVVPVLLCLLALMVWYHAKLVLEIVYLCRRRKDVYVVSEYCYLHCTVHFVSQPPHRDTSQTRVVLLLNT